MSRLRHLSVWVDEPEPGRFYWVIHEMGDDASVWTDIDSGPESYDLCLDALDAGTVAMMQLVDDERIGPRAPGEDEDEAPVG